VDLYDFRMGARAGQVFISYAPVDTSRAQDLAHTLRAADIAVGLDVELLRPGDDRARTLNAAIQNCSAFLACFSAKSVSTTVAAQNMDLYLAADEMRKR
jgi:hypothetical protein